MSNSTPNYIKYLLFLIYIMLFTSVSASAADTREFFIHTVHIDGKANIKGDNNHPPEAFPLQKLPDGRSLMLTKPDENGAWKMRAFAFEPSQIIVYEDDNINLHFVGVQGRTHTIHVEGSGIDKKFTLTRGYIETININSAEAGFIEIECYDHEPAMRAEIIILPKIKKNRTTPLLNRFF